MMLVQIHFALLLFSFVTFNIGPGFALRCYGCKDLDIPSLFKEYPKDAPKCKDGLGKEVDCSGSCGKTAGKDFSEFTFKSIWLQTKKFFSSSKSILSEK